MGFFEAFIRTLIFLACLAGCYFLTLWTLAAIGLAIPHQVEVILGVIFVLVAILVLVRLLGPFIANLTLFPSRDPPVSK